MKLTEHQRELLLAVGTERDVQAAENGEAEYDFGMLEEEAAKLAK